MCPDVEGGEEKGDHKMIKLWFLSSRAFALLFGDNLIEEVQSVRVGTESLAYAPAPVLRRSPTSQPEGLPSI